MNEETTPEETTVNTPNPEVTTTNDSPIEESPVDSSPSLETKELQKVNEKLDTIVEEMTKEPTPEELEKQQQEAEEQQKLLLDQQDQEQTYEQTSLENAQTEIEILQEISGKLSTLQSTTEEHISQDIQFHDESLKHSHDQTIILVFALAFAIGMKVFSDNILKW